MSLVSSLLGQEVRGYLVFEGFKISIMVNASKLVIRGKYKTYWLICLHFMTITFTGQYE